MHLYVVCLEFIYLKARFFNKTCTVYVLEKFLRFKRPFFESWLPLSTIPSKIKNRRDILLEVWDELQVCTKTQNTSLVPVYPYVYY